MGIERKRCIFFFYCSLSTQDHQTATVINGALLDSAQTKKNRDTTGLTWASLTDDQSDICSQSQPTTVKEEDINETKKRSSRKEECEIAESKSGITDAHNILSMLKGELASSIE